MAFTVLYSDSGRDDVFETFAEAVTAARNSIESGIMMADESRFYAVSVAIFEGDVYENPEALDGAPVAYFARENATAEEKRNDSAVTPGKARLAGLVGRE